MKQKNIYFIVGVSVALTVLVVLVLVFANSKAKEKNKQQEVFGVQEQKFAETIASYENSPLEVEVPIYDEKILLSGKNHFELGKDSGKLLELQERDLMSKYIFEDYPYGVVRKSQQGYYIMYDSDNGVRLYLYFLSEKNNMDYKYISGFPIVMKDTLTYKEFKSLEQGNTIEDVEKIDMVTNFYQANFDSYENEEFEKITSEGYGGFSVHLLKDGILKIIYERVKDEYIIKEFIYSEDFKLNCFNDELNFEINENDYMK